LLTTWLTADSVNPVEMIFPLPVALAIIRNKGAIVGEVALEVCAQISKHRENGNILL
jgi:hypothetical protein